MCKHGTLKVGIGPGHLEVVSRTVHHDIIRDLLKNEKNCTTLMVTYQGDLNLSKHNLHLNYGSLACEAMCSGV